MSADCERHVLAIDPGASGGMAVRAHGATTAFPMPGTGGDVVESIKSAVVAARCEGCEFVAVVERVGGFVGKGQPGSAMFKFGERYGFVLGALQGLGAKVVLVRPQEWQKVFGLGTAKAAGSKVVWKNRLKGEAQRRFPELKVTLATADALLINEWERVSSSGGE